MTLEITLRAAGEHKAFRRSRGYSPIEVDLFFCLGQSNSAGSTPVPNTVPFTTSADAAYSAQFGNYSPQMFNFPFKNGSSVSPGWGQSSAWPHFAEQWKISTGRSSVWLNLAVAGTPLRKESIAESANHWDVSELSKCLIGDYIYESGGETKTRRQMIADAEQAILANPKLKLGKKYVTWVQGEADANAYNTTSPAQYQERLNALFTYMKTEYGINHFGIILLGRKGTDESSVSTWENNSYSAFRDAQQAVADSRSDTSVIFSRMKELGSPFNTLEVDSDYFWVSGMEYQGDGVHLTSEGYRCMGRTAGYEMAEALGLVL